MLSEKQVSRIESYIDKRISELEERISPTLYTVEEVCDIIGISTTTFYRWQKGTNPVFTIVQRGHVKRIPKESLCSFMDEHTVQGKY